MTTLTLAERDTEVLIAQLPGGMSLKPVTLLGGVTGGYGAGQVLGRMTTDDSAAAGAAVAGGTGNGTITAAPTVNASAQVGVYNIICILPATDSGLFAVYRPDGTLEGFATVAVEYVGGVTFTIADGATDFALGDAFTVTVDADAALLYTIYDDSETNGVQIAVGVLLYEVPETAGGTNPEGTMIWRDAEVDDSMLVGEDAAALVDLAALGIFTR
jgi:Bacteriophage lambda head decoration protein D